MVRDALIAKYIWQAAAAARKGYFPSGVLSRRGYATEGRGGDASGGEALNFWSLILFGPCIFTAVWRTGLGVWQLQRREWKSDLLELRRTRLYAQPVDVTSIVSPDVVENATENELRYRQVLVQGTLVADKSVFVGPRMHRINEDDSKSAERGYLWIAPIDLSDGRTTALINMGWIPQQWRNDHMRYLELKDKGENPKPSKLARKKDIDELAIIRESENPSIFVPENVPAKQEWFYIDSRQLSRHLGLSLDSFLLEAIDNPTSRYYGTSFPAKRVADDYLSFSVMPNDHLLYAATWFILCTAVSYLAYKRLRTR